jgi:muramoyltetrapeptide carboxypeptidase
VGIISPAGPVNKTDLLPGLEMLASSGLEVRVASHVYSRRGYLAGPDEARIEDLHAMFSDPKIKAIFCSRGGYGCMRLLNRVHYEVIRANPKIFVGYSDITALLCAIHAKTGLVTFHGPMVKDLASTNDANLENMLGLIHSGRPLNLPLKAGTVLIPGQVEGPLIGGNLSLICHLLGTPFLPSLAGRILFLEEKGESLYRLDRMLTQLALSGQLEVLGGFLAGGFQGCSDASRINGLISEIFSGLEIPAVTGLPVGHGQKNMTLPMGVAAQLNTELMQLSISESCVK